MAIGARELCDYTKGMTIIETIILALIQAFTEFIPVSSSGHLLAAETVFSLGSSLALDVILHAGTLIALVVYFRATIIDLVRQITKGDVSSVATNIVISTIPAALAGFLLGDVIETEARVLWVVIVMLVTVGVVMIYSDRLFKQTNRTLDDMTTRQAAMIGLGQAVALIPGTSRSGITMLSAKAQGLSNKRAAEYSFLIGIPIIFGATVKVLLESETRTYVSDNVLSVAAGVVVAAVVGYVVLSYLLQFVAKHGLRFFGWYRLGLALILFIILTTQ